MNADLIEQNLEGVVPCFLYGATLLELGFQLTSESEPIKREELYCVTIHGVWRIE